MLMRETGLRPGDLLRLTRAHIQPTPEGWRAIMLKTDKSKRQRQVQIPVTPLAGQIIDATPPDQLLILRPRDSDCWTVGYLSQEISDHLDAIGLRSGEKERRGVHETGRRAGKPIHLTLYDLRGPACTRLVHAGLNIRELALHMGWLPSYASNMLNFYLALDTGQSDAVIRKLGFGPAANSNQEGKA